MTGLKAFFDEVEAFYEEFPVFFAVFFLLKGSKEFYLVSV